MGRKNRVTAVEISNSPLQNDQNEEARNAITKRLRRIEGQIRGIEKMVSDKRDCMDILTQLLAAESAIKHVGFSVIESHANDCIANSMQDSSKEEVVLEVMQVMRRFTK